MSDQRDPIAKRLPNGQIEYVCPVCGGWDRLCQVFHNFRPFIAHLIRDLCIKQHPLLQNPRIVGQEVWYQLPGTTRMLSGLPNYSPEYPEWKELLNAKVKIHSEAEVFLPDIGNWLEMALVSLPELNAIGASGIFTAERIVSLIASLGTDFEEQKTYLLENKDRLEQTGTDPKWRAKAGNQPKFIADSMAGARWGLTTSTSREMIRKSDPNRRRDAFEKLKIPWKSSWWLPVE